MIDIVGALRETHPNVASVAQILLYVSITFGTCLAVFYLFLKQRFMYWNKQQIEIIQPSFPFGNLQQVFFGKKHFYEVYNEIYKNMKTRFAGMFVVQVPTLMIKDPELVKSILIKDFDHFVNRIPFFYNEKDFLAAHLFRFRGQKWKDMRVKLTPTFTSAKMKVIFETLIECGLELERVLGKLADSGEYAEVKEFSARYTTDNIATVAFGIECKSVSNPEEEFRHYAKKTFQPNFENTLKALGLFFFPDVFKIFKIRLVEPDVHDFFSDTIEKNVEYREKHSVHRKDFLELLIQMKNKNETMKDGLTMKEIAAQAFLFFLAGFETSSSTMTFALYEIAKNPDILERLQKEIDEVLAKNDGKLTYDTLKDMKYLESVVAETLRMYPILPMLNRECSKDYQVPDSDFVIRQNTPIIIPVYSLHHDPDNFPDPEKFDPDRFSDENIGSIRPGTYLAFGDGPRNCIGKRMGQMQTKIGLIAFIRKYNICFTEKTQIPLRLNKGGVILNTEKTLLLKISHRTQL